MRGRPGQVSSSSECLPVVIEAHKAPVSWACAPLRSSGDLHLAIPVLQYRKKLLKRPRLHTQIAKRRFQSANHLIGFQQPDLITGQWWVGQQLKYPRLHFGQRKRDRTQDTLPIQHSQQKIQEHLETLNLRSPRLVGLIRRFGTPEKFHQPRGHIIDQDRLKLTLGAASSRVPVSIHVAT
jgi:hypothetical protein